MYFAAWRAAAASYAATEQLIGRATFFLASWRLFSSLSRRRLVEQRRRVATARAALRNSIRVTTSEAEAAREQAAANLEACEREAESRARRYEEAMACQIWGEGEAEMGWDHSAPTLAAGDRQPPMLSLKVPHCSPPLGCCRLCKPFWLPTKLEKSPQRLTSLLLTAGGLPADRHAHPQLPVG